MAKPVRVDVAALRARPGARGPAVRLLQQRLAAKGYVVGQRGLFDQRTARAVLAFRKVTGMARTTVADTGLFYPVAAAVLGAVFLLEAHRMWGRTRGTEDLSVIQPMRLFHASNLYLSLLFVAVVLDPLLTR